MNSANAYFSSIPNNLTITAPDATDGVAVHDLVQRCPPLDSNSLYCNLLQCTHFAATSALARFEDATTKVTQQCMNAIVEGDLITLSDLIQWTVTDWIA